MECGYQANARLDSTGNHAAYATLCRFLDDLLPCTQPTGKLRLDHENISRLAVQNVTRALQAIHCLVGCDGYWDRLPQCAHSDQVALPDRLLNVLYIELSTVGENGYCLLKVPGLICI